MDLAIVVSKYKAESLKNMLVESNILDDSRKIKRDDKLVELPVKYIPDIDIDFYVVDQSDNAVSRENIITPLSKIQSVVSEKYGSDVKHLPMKWEKFGDVLVLKLPNIKNKKGIAKIYADVLECKTVLEDVAGITGIRREPVVNVLYGTNSETTHIENGIKYRFDAAKIMFSSGNVDERIRMASLAESKEVVVDMFAGIGYFSLPIAFYGKAKVYACEINNVAYKYLKENIELNDVKSYITPLLGDCRVVAHHGIADRVVMGYFEAFEYVTYALDSLNDTGIIHIHHKCPSIDFPEKAFNDVSRIIEKHGKESKLLFSKKIKSYAPKIVHGVLDIEIT